MTDLIQIGLITLELGVILFIGFAGAKVLKRIHIPQVLGFILMGLIIGLPNRYIWKNGMSKIFITKDIYFWQFGKQVNFISYDFPDFI